MPLSDIIAKQAQWARTRWPGHVGLRAPSLAENLVCELTPEFRLQFKDGGGSELGNADKPGKMQSLRSSSALAFNVFAPWHGQDMSPLAKALGVSVEDKRVHFEHKYAHGLNSQPPNLDVVLDASQARPLGIESKFTEPYGKRKPEPPIADKYFANGRQRWSEWELPRCQDIAQALGKTAHFKRLGVGQLLKHVLGLAYSTKAKPRLLCVWYDSGCDEADEHREELRRFERLVGEEISFASHTYQDLIQALPVAAEPSVGYVKYLKARYLH